MIGDGQEFIRLAKEIIDDGLSLNLDMMRALPPIGVATGEGDPIVPVRQVIAPGGRGAVIQVNKGVERAVTLGVPGSGGDGAGPAIAAGRGVGSAGVLEKAGWQGSRSRLKIDCDGRTPDWRRGRGGEMTTRW